MVTSRSDDPRTAPGAWGTSGTSGTSCDVVTVPARQGLEAVDILRRGAGGDAVGPVLHDDGGDTLGFVVPAGTAAGWDVPGSVCTETEPPAEGAEWLLPVGEAELATDPAVLREALWEAQRLLDAADSCR